MFRSSESSLTMSCSERSCPAQSPKLVLPGVTSPGSPGTRPTVGGGTHICGHWAPGWSSLPLSHHPHSKPTK